MLQTCDVGFCAEEEGGGELLMLDVARNTGRNMVATQGGKTPDVRYWMLHVTAFTTFLQHVRNIYLVDFRSNG
jgi:hypothetical protein